MGTVHPLRRPRQKLAGTGFVVADGTLAVTCNHVLEQLSDRKPKERLAVFVGFGRAAQIRPATVVATDPLHDAAVLAFEGEPVAPLSLSISGVDEGVSVAFTGYPIGAVYGLHPVTHRGIVSAVTPIAIPQLSVRLLDAAMLQRLKAPFNVYQLDATAYPGNSGGPLYDPSSGQVIGIVSSVFVKETREKLLSEPSGITFAIPIRHAHELLTREGLLE